MAASRNPSVLKSPLVTSADAFPAGRRPEGYNEHRISEPVHSSQTLPILSPSESSCPGLELYGQLSTSLQIPSPSKSPWGSVEQGSAELLLVTLDWVELDVRPKPVFGGLPSSELPISAGPDSLERGRAGFEAV